MADTNATDVIIEDCLFERGVTADITDKDDIQVDQVLIRNNVHLDAPTDFIVLDNASTTGAMFGCWFHQATHQATVITVAAGLQTVCNRTLAGISVAQPA